MVHLEAPGQDHEAAAGSPPAAALHLPGCHLDELRQWVVAQGLERYRADQIADWIFAKEVESFEQMSNLSKPLRTQLATQALVSTARVSRVSTAADGTQKLLLTWPDGTAVETVWIPDADRHTACLSTQVGCPVGCRFCASGLDGLVRNLTAGEIVEQMLRVRRLIASAAAGAGSAAGAGPARLTNIVLMGMGEPLANYDAVLKAIRIINAPWGGGIAARKITLSTVGLPSQIRRLADAGLQINLALSLHAPDDQLRRELIPWGQVPIADLLAACAYYFERTGREITLEYVLLAGVNDQPRHVEQLALIAKRLRCNVNLLRYNPVPGLPFLSPSAEATYDFQARLRERGLNAHVRTSRGKDIDAACGQLRRRVATSANGAGGGDDHGACGRDRDSPRRSG